MSVLLPRYILCLTWEFGHSVQHACKVYTRRVRPAIFLPLSIDWVQHQRRSFTKFKVSTGLFIFLELSCSTVALLWFRQAWNQQRSLSFQHISIIFLTKFGSFIPCSHVLLPHPAQEQATKAAGEAAEILAEQKVSGVSHGCPKSPWLSKKCFNWFMTWMILGNQIYPLI